MWTAGIRLQQTHLQLPFAKYRLNQISCQGVPIGRSGYLSLGYPLLQAAAGKTPEISGNIIQPVRHFDNGPARQYGAILRNFDRHRALEKFNSPLQMSSQMGDCQINRTLELFQAILHSFEYLRDPCIACLASVHLPDLIEHHGGIVAAAGASLQRVAGCPPRLPVVRPAADGGCRFHCGGLTVRRFPLEVIAAAVHTNQP